MIEVPLVAPVPGVFSYVDGQTYYTELLSHTLLENMNDLKVAGYKISVEEATDMSDFTTALNTFYGLFETWVEEAFTARAAGLPVPTVPSLPVPVGGIYAIPIYLIGRIVVKIIGRWIEKRFEHDPTEDLNDIVDVLKLAFIGENPGGDFPLISQLANTPLEIILSRFGEYEDIVYSDRPLV